MQLFYKQSKMNCLFIFYFRLFSATGSILRFYGFMITSCVVFDHLPKSRCTLRRYRIIHPFPFFPPNHEITVTQKFHMMGKSRLCDF